MLAELISPVPAWILVGGKGGVGKTTVAASLAVALADAGHRTLVLSTDPAHSLGDALGVRLGPEPRAVGGVARLHALEVDAASERERFLARHRHPLVALMERGTYLAPEEVDGFLELSLPGMDELAALLRLLTLSRGGGYDHVVVDTAPTGHTLRLLALPGQLEAWLASLRALEESDRAVANAFSAVSPVSDTTRFLDTLEADRRRLAEWITDVQHTGFLLVTTPEPVVMAETRRYRDALTAAGVAVSGILINRVAETEDADTVVREVAGEWRGQTPIAHLPRLPRDPQDIPALREFAGSVQPARAPRRERRASEPVEVEAEVSVAQAVPELRAGEPYHAPRGRALYVVGGKGGVGKTTIASALAVSLAHSAVDGVLLLSTDPAGSLGDVWQTIVAGTPAPAPGVAGLMLRQVDAAAAWTAFHAESRATLGRVFTGMSGAGATAGLDRRAVERLLEVAPPGVDELMALQEVVDQVESPAYNAVVLDTAPTGHLLRLLETPDLALTWTHAILRVLLRYRDVVGLGDFAERVLRVARTMRGLRGLLRDPARTWIGIAALPEALSVPETERLVSRLRGLGLTAEALLINRLLSADGAMPRFPGSAARALVAGSAMLDCVALPEWTHGPRGADELARFAHAWRRVAPDEPRENRPNENPDA